MLQQSNRAALRGFPAHHELPFDELVNGLRVRPETVRGWIDGTRPAPPYFADACQAVREGLRAVPALLVRGYPQELGLKSSHVEFWIRAGQVPYPARLAVAWIINRKITGR